VLNTIMKEAILVPATQLLFYCKLFVYYVIATSFFLKPTLCEVVSSQDSQCTCNVTLRCVSASIVAMEKQ